MTEIAMNLQEVIQLQVLKLKAAHSGRGALLERMIESGQLEPDGALPLRQMCAKVSFELYQDLENTCAALDMSKREFIEAAVSDAIEQAKAVIEKSGGLEAMYGVDDQGKL